MVFNTLLVTAVILVSIFVLYGTYRDTADGEDAEHCIRWKAELRYRMGCAVRIATPLILLLVSCEFVISLFAGFYLAYSSGFDLEITKEFVVNGLSFLRNTIPCYLLTCALLMLEKID